MQRDFAYVVVCTILATQLLSPAEGDDDNPTEKVDHDDYEGNADKLFQFLQTLENDTVLFTIKRSYERNIRASQSKTVTCIKATKMFVNQTAAELCTIYKTLNENATRPYPVKYTKTSPDMIEGPSLDRMTVHYVSESEQCIIVQHMSKTPLPLAIRSCDMLRGSLDSTGTECNNQFRRLCGSSTELLSTSEGCSGVPTPECNKASLSTSTATASNGLIST
uniref:Putative secreted protein n=1 Tax=Ixodes ricinus TaxID=34613 RepID=A0A6B0V5J8_IXORI